MTDFDTSLELLLRAALKEDIGDGDHTTLSCIPPGANGRAVLKIKQDGIIAGVKVAKKIFLIREPHAIFRQFKEDGEPSRSGEQAFEVEAGIHTILTCERLVLNCMQRMSGIASLTRTYVDRVAGYRAKILDTRKTTPNFRLLEKDAVRIGGGMNHRFGLYDMILIKDNHIDYCGGIEKAIEKAFSYAQAKTPVLQIEVETRTIEDVRRVMAVGKINRIMLDNFLPDQISQAMEIINHQYETEASGGINLDNLVDYAKTGVDFISIGALIHQAKSLDLSLKAVLL
jgi:nicotinate-nucleotide pyrophosphorylase (carboxylating)